ncbi:MAG: TMEM164-related integral membrane acyltransferase [Saccharofermentanales bacterium]
MWQYFWKFQTEIPEAIYMRTFSTTHIILSISGFILIFLIALLYRRQSVTIRRRIEIVFALMLSASYVFRWIWVIAIGHYSATDMLPLHLCALSAGTVIIGVFSRKPIFKEFGYACGLPGGIVTFIMPGEPYPIFHFYFILFIIAHFILILMPILWVWGDGFRPEPKRLGKCFIILLIMASFDIFINNLIGSNFMFLRYAPPNTPLSAAAKWAGNPGYQFYMALILFGVWLLLYTPWVVMKKMKSREKQSVLLRLPE